MCESKKEGENIMNASAVKPTLPFVTRKRLERTPASAENKQRVDFMNNHNFSFSVDKETGSLQCKVEKK